MGAIAGIINIAQSKQGIESDVMNMLSAIRHRAIHASHHVVGDGTAMAARFNGDEEKSMAWDEADGISVVLDGEVLRHRHCDAELCRRLPDAAGVLYLYKKMGESFLKEIDGVYALGIWDSQRKKAILARDRYGFKPLFYSQQQGGIIFSSEIKAIKTLLKERNNISWPAIDHFLSYGYVPHPQSMFENVFQVSPGHVVVYKNGSTVEHSYWSFAYQPEIQLKSEREYLDRFYNILKSSVNDIIGRYPDSGSFLSGGLDSSSVVSMMAELKQSSFKVFTAGFNDEQYNEFQDAAVVAQHFGLEHLTTVISEQTDFPKLLEKIVWYYDAPFADTSAIPSYYGAKAAKELCDTVLTGDFPDQLIGGSGHQAFALERQANLSPLHRLLQNRHLNRIIARLPLHAGTPSLSDRIKRMVYRESFSLEMQRVILDMPVPPLLKRCLYSQDLWAVNKDNDPLERAESIYAEVKSSDLLNKLLYFDVVSYAPDDLAVKVDRMTRAHGLRALSPFHNLDLVEFIASIPSDFKIRNGVRKYVMKAALRPHLPMHTLNKKKKGFDMPLERWLVKKFPEFVSDILFDQKTMERGYFNKKFLRQMVENYLNSRLDYASGSDAAIISLITLELWHRVFIDV